MSDRHVHAWLLAMVRADCTPPGTALSPQEMASLLELADRHGVLPQVLAGLDATSLSAADRAAIDAAKAGLRMRLGGCMLLRMQLRQIADELLRQSLKAIVIKGATFADRLYADPSLRTFTDVDLLAPSDAFDGIHAAMLGLGYQTQKPAMKYADGYGEISFSRPAAGGNVELHWNVVNSPTLRRRVSVAYEDLQLLDGDQRSAGLPAMSPASMLLVAAVHGAASHGFDRLQLLVDVRQAVNGTAGPLDEGYLRSAIDRTGAGFALASALELTDRLLGVPACRELSGRLGLTRPAGLGLLLSRGVVLRCHARRDSFRRQMFRSMLKKK